MKPEQAVNMTDGLLQKHCRRRIVQTALIAAVLALLAFSAFSDALNCSFISLDDPHYVYHNPQVTQGLTPESVQWAFLNVEQGNWHPLTWLSHMLDVELYGLNPKGHHLTSLIFHTLNALLCFWLFFLLTGSLWPGALIALFFAIHPLRAESVVWISERKDVLCAFFGLLSLITYRHYVTERKLSYYLLTFVLLLLGLMSKSMLVTWPFVFLLLDFWPFKRFKNRILHLENAGPVQQRSLWFLIKEKLPFMVLIVLFSGIAYWSQANRQAVQQFQTYPVGLRLQNVAVSYVAYIGKIFAPFSLSIFYPITISRYTVWKCIAALFFLAAVTFVVIRLRYKKPCLVTGWFWYLGTLIPVIGIVHIGYQSMADRYTYLPGLGILLILVWLGTEIAAKRRLYKTILTAAAVAAAAALLITSWVQTTYWKNSVTLYEHAADVTGLNPPLWRLYGRALQTEGQLDAALEQYQKILKIYPEKAEPWLSIGSVYLEKRQFQKAEKYLLQAYRLSEEDSCPPLLLLSQTYWGMGKRDLARQYLTEAIKIADRRKDTSLKKELLEFQKQLQKQPNSN